MRQSDVEVTALVSGESQCVFNRSKKMRRFWLVFECRRRAAAYFKIEVVKYPRMKLQQGVIIPNVAVEIEKPRCRCAVRESHITQLPPDDIGADIGREYQQRGQHNLLHAHLRLESLKRTCSKI